MNVSRRVLVAVFLLLVVLSSLVVGLLHHGHEHQGTHSAQQCTVCWSLQNPANAGGDQHDVGRATDATWTVIPVFSICFESYNYLPFGARSPPRSAMA